MKKKRVEMKSDPHENNSRITRSYEYENGNDIEDEDDDEATTSLMQDGNDESDESSELTASEDLKSWIQWFTEISGNNFFCVVDDDFIQDDFNLTGLHKMVPYYDYALDMILDVDIPPDSNLTLEQHGIVETAAEVLYGLIHSRYILTSRGMQQMQEKFANADFGVCPRVYCEGQPALPIGLSDNPRDYSVNIYCPRCQDVYFPRKSKSMNLDGAYFGTTFAHLFLLLHPELIPSGTSTSQYVPRIYGFKISKESEYYKQNVKESRNKVVIRPSHSVASMSMSITESSPLDTGIHGTQDISLNPKPAHAALQNQSLDTPQMGSNNCQSSQAINDQNFERKSYQNVVVKNVS